MDMLNKSLKEAQNRYFKTDKGKMARRVYTKANRKNINVGINLYHQIQAIKSPAETITQTLERAVGCLETRLELENLDRALQQALQQN